MNDEGYQLVEPVELDGLAGVPKNLRLAYGLLDWLIAELRAELGSELAGARLEIVRVEYHGAYPAIGIHYDTETTQDLAPLIEATITRLLKERPVLAFVAYAESSTTDWNEAADALLKVGATLP